MKIRVLQLIGSFHQGGSERQAVALTRALAEDGRIEVRIAALNKEGILLKDIESLDLDDVPEFRLTSFYNLNFIRQVRALSRYLRANGINVIHSHDFYSNILGMAAGKLARLKGRIASKRETGGMRTRAQEFVEGVAFGRANAIVANSAAVREHLIKRGVKSEKISVIYNGLDLGRFAQANDRQQTLAGLGLPDKKLVVAVANLRHSVKNIPMLLRAAARIKGTLPDVHFVVAGEGGLKDELAAMAASLCIGDRVHFIGRCTDVPALLDAAYACVLTSTAEGFSNSILEYMAAGKPVIATDVGGAAEAVINDETGYLVASDDDPALADKLLDLICDEAKASRFGAAGRRIIEEKFSTERQLSDTAALYESLVK
ncbi:MAG: glycosyltransferase [Acidobacteria bacterium]|nr:glycosyltransferase [Acidobacteriota bacterium]